MLDLDHVGFAVRSLPRLLSEFRNLGFTITQPAPLMAVDGNTKQPSPIGQTSAHIVMARSYIELTAVPDPQIRNHLQPYLKRYEGLHILAVRNSQIDAAHARIVGAGLAASALQSASRRIEYGQRHGEACFRWFMLAPEESPEGLICLVKNETPELVFQPEVQTHSNAALDLAGLWMCTADVEQTAARYAPVFGPVETMTSHRASFRLGNATITLLTPSALGEFCPTFTPPAVPALVGVEIGVSAGSASEIKILPPPANALLILTPER